MKSNKKSAILRILQTYAEKFRPKSLDTPCKSLKSLYLDSCLNITFKDLQNKCSEIFHSIPVSQEEALNIESQTKIRVRAKNAMNYGLAEKQHQL